MEVFGTTVLGIEDHTILLSAYISLFWESENSSAKKQTPSDISFGSRLSSLATGYFLTFGNI